SFICSNNADTADIYTVSLHDALPIFKIPNTSKRVDFIVAGNDGNHDHVVIVELKQWSEVERITTKDALVNTYIGGAKRPVAHPRSEEHTSELQSRENLVCRLLLETKK